MKGFHRKNDLEARLRAERPQPKADFLASVEDRIRTDRTRSRGRRLQVAFAGGLTAAMLAALASVGGLSYAASGVNDVANAAKTIVGDNSNSNANDNGNSASEHEYPHKVLVCHNGHTISIDQHALNAHLRQGDTLGPCP